jgi:hypothetical protein
VANFGAGLNTVANAAPPVTMQQGLLQAKWSSNRKQPLLSLNPNMAAPKQEKDNILNKLYRLHYEVCLLLLQKQG